MSDPAPSATNATGPVAALIIPLRVSPALFEWEPRLERILATIPRDLFEIVVVDYGTAAPSRPRLEAIVAAADVAARMVRIDCADRPFAIGQARDTGVIAARAPVVLFNDIDFIGPPAAYRAIAAEIGRQGIAEHAARFFCIPVVFLSEQASASYLAAPSGLEGGHAQVRAESAAGASGPFGSIAYGSSCIVVNRRQYLAVGGHARSFTGHGAEDFELMHRLAAIDPLAPRPPFYAVDFKDNGIARYRGFRAHFALHGIEAFQRGVFLVHLHHPGRPIRGYFRAQKRNFRALSQAMAAFDRSGRHPPPLPGAVGPPVLDGGRVLPLEAPLFRPFGGGAAMAEAARLAEREASGGLRPGAFAAMALAAYRLVISWRLPRRERILLRHVPAEYLATRRDLAARLIARRLSTKARSVPR